jgi:signal transduction histidine kinase
LLQDEFEKIRSRFGQEAAEAARELAEKTTAVHIRAAVHDIRNIITYLRPTEELTEDPKYRRNVNRIITGRSYLKRMLDMMDKYTLPLTVEKSSESVVDVLEESVLAARGQIKEEGFDSSKVEVFLGIPEGISFSVARLEIVMALSNIIKNAIEAHGRKERKIQPGKVKIGGTVEGGFIRIHIRDFGHGLSQEDLNGLLAFTPGKTSKLGGSGYGLPLCHRYICAHGGRLELDSRENQGTIATVILPIGDNHPTLS